MVRTPELSGLQCFLAVAEELHFGRAATQLNITQPTISQKIRKLEQCFGVSLFSRSTRNVELTASGEVLVPLAKDILSKVEEAAILSKLAGGGMSPGGEHLKIGAIDPAAHQLLPTLLRRFRTRFPETQLDVKIYDSLAIVRALEQDECHVGIMRPPINANLLSFRQLASQRFVAVIPAKSELCTQTKLQLTHFKNQRVFTLNRFELSSFEAVYNEVTAAGIAIDDTIQVSNTAAALAAASAGVGTTFLPEWVESIADENVVLKSVEDLSHEIPIGIGWRSDSPVPGIFPFVECALLVSRLGLSAKSTKEIGSQLSGRPQKQPSY